MTAFLFHPSRARLVAFAADDEFAARARVARHLERCTDCRQFVGFTRRFENAVQALPAPAPGDDILLRALADRASGARVILPAATEPARHTLPGRAMRAFAILIVAVTLTLWWSGRGGQGEFASTNELLLAGFVPRTAEAGQVRPAGVVPHHLRPVTATYQRRFIDSSSGRTTDAGKLDLRVARGSLTPETWLLTSAWREIERWSDMSNARTWTESLTVAGPALVPASRAVHVKPYSRWAGIHIDQRFRNDSVVGQMSLDEDPTRRPIARDLRAQRGRLIASDALAPVYFMGVPLSPGAEFDVSILGWAVVPRDVFVPMHMKVAGSERVETPAGTFDCWKFIISVGGETHYHWVRQTDHLAVRTLRKLRDGRMRELILLHEDSNQ
jgi:hypothetical protein